MVELNYCNAEGVCAFSAPLLGRDILLLDYNSDTPASEKWMNDNVINYFIAEMDLRDKVGRIRFLFKFPNPNEVAWLVSYFLAANSAYVLITKIRNPRGDDLFFTSLIFGPHIRYEIDN
jgi:hypothetical protein